MSEQTKNQTTCCNAETEYIPEQGSLGCSKCRQFCICYLDEILTGKSVCGVPCPCHQPKNQEENRWESPEIEIESTKQVITKIDPPLQATTEGWEKDFDERFCPNRICRCCGKNPCDYSTTGCPWYEKEVLFDKNGQTLLHKDLVISFISSLLTQRTEEIKRMMPKQIMTCYAPNDISRYVPAESYKKGYNQALDDLLTAIEKFN